MNKLKEYKEIFILIALVMLCCLMFCYKAFAKTEAYCTSSETKCMPMFAPELGKLELVCHEVCLKYRHKTESTSKKELDDDTFSGRWKDLGKN